MREHDAHRDFRYRYQLEAFVDKVRGRTPPYWPAPETTISKLECIERTYEKVTREGILFIVSDLRDSRLECLQGRGLRTSQPHNHDGSVGLWIRALLHNSFSSRLSHVATVLISVSYFMPMAPVSSALHTLTCIRRKRDYREWIEAKKLVLSLDRHAKLFP